jgi:hypothetical protein
LDRNNITSLDLTKNTKLSYLTLYVVPIATVDLKNNSELTYLDCAESGLTSLNLVGKTKLETLFLGECTKLKSLDISGCTALTKLQVTRTALTSLDVSSAKGLTTLLCSEIPLKMLDVGNLPENAKISTDDSLIRVTETYLMTRVTKLKSASNVQKGIQLTWGKVSGATGYLIYRKTQGGQWTKYKRITSGTTSSFVDTGVKNGTLYRYAIKSYCIDEDGYITYGELDSTGKLARRILQPVLLTPVNTTKGVNVKWKKVAGVTGYQIFRRVGASKTWTKIATVKGANTVSYVDKKATKNCTVYAYTVKAYYGSAISSCPKGKALYFVTAPTGFTSLSNTAKGRITAAWKRNSKATGYQLQYSADRNFETTKTVTVKGNTNIKKNINGLTKGKIYYVRVRAYKKGATAAYYSAWSAAKKIIISK